MPLCFDIYEPDCNSIVYRPLVITLYGGAFVVGSRNNSDMRAYCKNLAQCGYRAVTIDYSTMKLRCLSSRNLIRTAYMAAQDLSTAIRFFKANYYEYGIDTTNIFLLGSSSGSIVILHEMFMDNDERPMEIFEEPYLGELHSKGDTVLLHHSNEVAGAIIQWGGILNTSMIDLEKLTKNNFCFIHCEGDPLVPFTYGHCFSMKFIPCLYGSKDIVSYIDDLGFNNYDFYHFEQRHHAYYYNIIYGIGLNKKRFDVCLQITLDFLEKSINNAYYRKISKENCFCKGMPY